MLSAQEMISQYDSLNEEELASRIRQPMPKSEVRKLRYYARKSEMGELTKEDQVEYLRLAELNEEATLVRLCCLSNLAQRRQVPFETVAKEFGFDFSKHKRRR